jgi:hypothetical protein
MREVGHDLGKAGAKGLLKRFEGIEIEVTDGEIGSGCTGHHAGKTLVDGGFAKSGANELVDERDVLLAVVGQVEVIAGLVGIHDGNFDHRASWGAKRNPERIRQCELGKGQGHEERKSKLVGLLGMPVIGILRCGHSVA